MSILTLFMIVGPIAILAGGGMMVAAVRSGGVGARKSHVVYRTRTVRVRD